ncbi:hypothetical protein [Clostridium saccharobutylicum]|uniref:Uncharacterized protein n=1 Tax=Clostridium saccharobutylicum TaxID=169679 RepID=A0A1S8NCV2_CLOSA|nr:hypothetical protein [Clostridium saccharobutylicum]OOM14218.1 hypothetical protein CLOSAC_10910 [Clostridium saccharobutylicum]
MRTFLGPYHKNFLVICTIKIISAVIILIADAVSRYNFRAIF